MRWRELNYWLLGSILTVCCFYNPPPVDVWDLLCAILKDLYIYVPQVHSCLVNINILWLKLHSLVLINRVTLMFIIEIIVRSRLILFFMYCLFEVICFLYLQTIIFPSWLFIFSIIGISWWFSVIPELHWINDNDLWKVNVGYQYFNLFL